MSGVTLDTSRAVTEAAPLEEMPVGVPSYADVVARAERAEADLADLRRRVQSAEAARRTFAGVAASLAASSDVRSRADDRERVARREAAQATKERDALHASLSDLLAALPRCRQCTSPATGRYDTDDRYCDAHRIEGNDLWCAYDWAPALRRALAERGRA